MKTELVDVNETRKNLRVEIPSDVVDAEIDRVARDYCRSAPLPGFRPGKVAGEASSNSASRIRSCTTSPTSSIPRAVGDALRERGVEPVDTPDIRDVSVEEGQALTFTAAFDTVPPFDPGEYSTIALRRPAGRGGRRGGRRGARAAARTRGPLRAGRGRGVDDGDTVAVDLERQRTAKGDDADRHKDVEHRARRDGEPARASTRSCKGSRSAATKTFRDALPRRLRGDGAGRHRRRPTRSRCKSMQAPRAAGARRRVRQGPRRVRDARGAAGARARGSRGGSAARGRARQCGTK